MLKKRRGLISVVMVLSVIAFVGFSIAPIVDSIVRANQASSSPSPTPMQTTTAKQSDLQAQARGYELVLQREPDNQTALKGLLQVRLELIQAKQGEIKDVIGPLERLSKLNPENGEYAILLAQAKDYSGDREGAAQAYRSVLTLKPGDVKALQGLVNLLLNQKRPEAAIGLLQDTLKAAPAANLAKAGSIDVNSVQLILGQVYADQKRFDEAIAIYDEGIKADNKDFRPLLAKAIVLKEKGKTEDAKVFFTKASDLAPANFKDQIKQLASGNPAPTSSPTTTTKKASPTPQASPTKKN
ncbi:Tfp pilus assembly protein PilF [Oscillatoriales cyanobacterium USR001]|nr:Tfp pilus assembly protein PilF [Oscillatoriales cyanobacterium USR001]